MVERQSEDLPDGKELADELDLILQGKRSWGNEPQAEPVSQIVSTELSDEETYTIEKFISHQIPVTAHRDLRQEVEGFYRAFPVWREEAIKFVSDQKNKIPQRQEFLNILEGLTLGKVAEMARNKFEELARQKGRMIPDPNDMDYQEISAKAEYWSRVEQIAKGASEMGESGN